MSASMYDRDRKPPVEECVFCHGETRLPPLSCKCTKGAHHVCQACENKYGELIELDLVVCPLSDEFKVAEELMGEEREDDLKAYVRKTRKALKQWAKENPY